MKKFISILMTLLIIMSITIVPVFAAEPAKTSVDVKKGDEVVYTLKLTVPEKVVGCDFSIYFDSSVLRVKDVADFTGNFDQENWQAVINANLKDQIIGNWSILSGVSFDNRAMITVKFEASKAATTNISYYVRYLYPESLEQFTTYDFKCDVAVNGSKVVKDAAPELNVEEPQSNGRFVNSVTGDSDDADVNIADKKPSGDNANNGGEGHEGDVDNNTTKDNDKETTAKETTVKDKETENDADSTEADSDSVEETVNSPATPSQTGNDGGVFTSIWFWIIIAVVVIGGGAGAFVVIKKKKTTAE
ncbi:MAG: hypothetical protein IJ015_05235 [Ruminococcus sp.]|nr:hypothetical protein [Ruminococcus sp.]